MYAPPDGVHDEMLGPDGQARPHWRAFLNSFAALSPDDLVQRWELGQNLLRDNGVTYNVHGDPEGLERPWTLDPMPLLLPAAEWDWIARAVAQRAGLLNEVMADLYGKRTLIGLGLVPPALLHANPAFLRPCHGWMPAGGHHLHMYAVDLVRGADGAWRVLADRTESPAGAGYALENRTIVNRILPEQFRATHIERLAPFFEALRRSLQALSPRRTETPQVVLLTPGPYNETYFEHAFLARHLGLTLVQGEDLTVRDSNVYMKTLTGLQQVDVILRRTTGEWCDPLELRGDSTLGVAGLLQSARAGNVAVVNALGSGLLDGGAIQSFLPSIARHLLGESLMMTSVPSWWCGNDSDRAFVAANLHRLVLRPAFHNRISPRLGAALSETEHQAAIADIMARPTDWVAQQVDSLSTVPVWSEGNFEPRSMVLRVFAVSTESGWQVMPGGLARVSTQGDLLTARLQTGGGGSKDLWIIAEQSSTSALLPRRRSTPVKLVRGNRDLPSRVADNMFWLGRYVERCEGSTRLLRAALSRIEEALDQNDPARAIFTARIMARLGLHIPPQALEKPETLPRALIAHHLGGGEDGLSEQVDQLLRVVINLRDRLSVDTWRALQRLRDDVRRLHLDGPRSDTPSRLNDLILTIEAVNGLSMENMTRGPLWLFMDSGRRVERATTIVDTLGGALTDAESEDAVPMELLLDLWDSAMTYRSRYLAAPRLAAVLDLLLCDESNPRSLGFQLAALSEHMDTLAQIAGSNGFLRAEQRLMTVLCGTARTTDALVLARYDRDGGYHDAERLLENFRSRLWELSEVLSREYFSHAQWRLPVRPPELLA
ncbi:circularly permuted type 2 ATP-grasp protein [Magnetospirillum sulfuroxidans]|uniref:Circularly permuted type 2 ATP-grasp protein n=1 Tax=Magnetospirillum sulfuroxidans TaxID=611300 RepID=A0ABS5I9E4_9PROT|nr:circularly permuted type 2 ATP-grasp protein [Magnetospirillum sulfuroxidans]MBR9971031.1 circularly permuted type 2 ATP-grasp protein [Magnetospirillum sulfuroxidans]